MTQNTELYISIALTLLFCTYSAILLVWCVKHRLTKKNGIMNDLECELGDDGTNEPSPNLRPFSASYRINGRRFGIVVWANSFADARAYCARHGFTFDPLTDGEIVGHSDS